MHQNVLLLAFKRLVLKVKLWTDTNGLLSAICEQGFTTLVEEKLLVSETMKLLKGAPGIPDPCQFYTLTVQCTVASLLTSCISNELVNFWWLSCPLCCANHAKMYGNRTDLTIGLCSAIEKLWHYRHCILPMYGIKVHVNVKIQDFVRHLI